jgi:mono/diheme cytochrome c family protein
MDRRAPRRLAPVVATVALFVTTGLVAAACGGGDDEASEPTTGREIYTAYCATCHGVDGQGGVGPALAGRMEEAFPDVEDQIAVVANGRGTMPAFGSRLSAGAIREVVEYERTELGR